MNTLWRAALAALLAGAGASAQGLEREELPIDTDLTYTLDDNQSQAMFRRDQIEDRSLGLGAKVSYGQLLTDHSLLSGSLFGEVEQMSEVEQLDRATFGLKGALRWQPSSAFSAPNVEFNLSWQDDDYGDDARDSGVFISQLFVTRRMTDRITTTAGLQYRNRDSAGSVWDLEDARLFLNADYAVGHAAAYATYSYIEGDSFSSAQRIFCNGLQAQDTLPLINIQTANEPDEAYNEYHCGEWFAYRLDTHSHTFVLGANYGFSHTFSADVSVLYADVTATEDSDVTYQRRLIRASLLKRF